MNWKKIVPPLARALLAVAVASAAAAQSIPQKQSPGSGTLFTQGYTATLPEWTAAFSGKQDTLGPGGVTASMLASGAAATNLGLPPEAVGVMIGGDYYGAKNATWDGVHWNFVDTSAPAFLWQYNIANNMIGESYKALTLWRAAPGSNPIGAFTTMGGWLMAFSFSEYGDFSLGSNGIEVDGNGAPPYGRLQHSIYGGENRTGLVYNAYLSEAWVDDVTKPSWFAGIAVDGSGVGGFRIRRAPAAAGAPVWVDLLKLDDAGNLAPKGYVAGGGGTYAVVSAWTSVPPGARSWISDAASCASRLSAVAGGGSTFCPVVYSGSTWLQD